MNSHDLEKLLRDALLPDDQLQQVLAPQILDLAFKTLHFVAEVVQFFVALRLGGELPLRREQSLLIANLKSEFKPDWYWSGEPNGDGWAWCQSFTSGSQNGTHAHRALRARAVRRLVIE